MRRQLNLLVVAVTLLVVIAFVGPLAYLVRQQADQRARLVAEHQAQGVASSLVRSIRAGTSDPVAMASSLRDLPDDITVLVGGAVVRGEEQPIEWLPMLAVNEGRAQSTYSERGWELALPVLTAGEPIVVYTVVPQSELLSGVARAWGLLAILAIGLLLAAVMVADGLARAMVRPSSRIADAALRLGSGDLDVRVREEGPAELRRVAAAFNTLARRLRALLATEREAVADLSHRLRTPLTAVRLEAGALKDPGEREALLVQVERMQLAVDEMIMEARRPAHTSDEKCDIVEVVSTRIAFWSVLAEHQGRQLSVSLPPTPGYVAIRSAEAAAVADALIDNVFKHTEPGVAFQVKVGHVGSKVILRVADAGQGFSESKRSTQRGWSDAGSTGLGLDIARRLAERTGGTIRVGTSKAGGGLVEVSFVRLD